MKQVAGCIALFDLCMFAVATSFGVEIAHGGSPITPEQYGAAVYEVPALVWVYTQQHAALIGLAGAFAMLTGWRTRLWALVACAGNLGLAALFGAFAVLAAQAGHESLVYHICAFGAGPLAFAASVYAGRHFVWGDRA